LDHRVVEDAGVALNPMVVKGQLHGGIVQGPGAALRARRGAACSCQFDRECDDCPSMARIASFPHLVRFLQRSGHKFQALLAAIGWPDGFVLASNSSEFLKQRCKNDVQKEISRGRFLLGHGVRRRQ
jgi:Molybdopterin-binding domain of aldehyde dehydrogenase